MKDLEVTLPLHHTHACTYTRAVRGDLSHQVHMVHSASIMTLRGLSPLPASVHQLPQSEPFKMDLGHSGIPSVHPLELGSIRFICDRAASITTANPCDTLHCQRELQKYVLTLKVLCALVYKAHSPKLDPECQCEWKN